MQNLEKWLALVGQFAPVILSLFGVNPVIGQLISVGIQTEEAVQGPGTGASKKAAVETGVAAGLTALNASQVAAGKKPIADPSAIAGQVGQGIDLVVQVVNDLHKATATLPTSPVPPGAQA